MADYSIWILGASNITVSGGEQLSGFTQGDGSHLVGETIRLENNSWEEVFISDNGSDANFDDNDGNQRLDGAQVIDGISYGNNREVEAEYLIVLRDPATGIEYTAIAFNIDEPGSPHPQYGTVEGLAFVGGVGGFPPIGVDLEVVSASEGPGSSGIPALPEADTASPVCFTAGTRIATPRGPVPVEALERGDEVLRADGGTATVRARLERRVSAVEMIERPTFRPVRISAGALGPGVPERDLLVSRQHRMRVSSSIAARMFGQPEVLVAAVRLTVLPGVEIAEPAEVTYVHLVLDRHEVILAEGAPSESFFPGPVALDGLSDAALAELRALFPEAVAGQGPATPACPIPDGHRQRRLVARHLRNAKPLVPPA